MATVYKVLRPDELTELLREGQFKGSPDDQRDGFIHLSTTEQLPGTLDRHFAGENNVFLLSVLTHHLDGALRWERSRKGELFPHLYECLQLKDVLMILPPPAQRALATALAVQGCDSLSQTLAG